ncbi:uncharacterized protein ACB058_005187 isoform 1-T2 [Synchiropus picturatus]
MADTDPPQQTTPEEEEDIYEDEALQIFSKYAEARRALPWDQWTLREKISYYLDRLFLAFLVIFFIVFFCEIVYKLWHIANVNKIGFVKDSIIGYVFNWLFTQDRQEQLADL